MLVSDVTLPSSSWRPYSRRSMLEKGSWAIITMLVLTNHFTTDPHLEHDLQEPTPFHKKMVLNTIENKHVFSLTKRPSQLA